MFKFIGNAVNSVTDAGSGNNNEKFINHTNYNAIIDIKSDNCYNETLNAKQTKVIDVKRSRIGPIRAYITISLSNGALFNFDVGVAATDCSDTVDIYFNRVLYNDEVKSTYDIKEPEPLVEQVSAKEVQYMFSQPLYSPPVQQYYPPAQQEYVPPAHHMYYKQDVKRFDLSALLSMFIDSELLDDDNKSANLAILREYCRNNGIKVSFNSKREYIIKSICEFASK